MKDPKYGAESLASNFVIIPSINQMHTKFNYTELHSFYFIIVIQIELPFVQICLSILYAHRKGLAAKPGTTIINKEPVEGTVPDKVLSAEVFTGQSAHRTNCHRQSVVGRKFTGRNVT